MTGVPSRKAAESPYDVVGMGEVWHPEVSLLGWGAHQSTVLGVGACKLLAWAGYERGLKGPLLSGSLPCMPLVLMPLVTGSLGAAL